MGSRGSSSMTSSGGPTDESIAAQRERLLATAQTEQAAYDDAIAHAKPFGALHKANAENAETAAELIGTEREEALGVGHADDMQTIYLGNVLVRGDSVHEPHETFDYQLQGMERPMKWADDDESWERYQNALRNVTGDGFTTREIAAELQYDRLLAENRRW